MNGGQATRRQGPTYCRAFVTSTESFLRISIPTTHPTPAIPKAPTPSPFLYKTCLQMYLPPLPPYHRCQLARDRKQELAMRVLETLLRQLRSADPAARLIEATGYQEQQHLLGMDALQHDTPVLNYLQAFCVQLDGSHPSPCQVTIVHYVNPYELLESLQVSDNEGHKYNLRWSRYSETASQDPQDLAHRIQAWKRENFLLDKPYSARVNALATILKTSDDSTVVSLVQTVLKSSPPITCHKAKLLLLQEAKVLLSPQAVEESLHVHNLPSHHSALSKLPSLRWLLALLERKRTTSWDLVATNRLWKGPFLGL
jgi:hypothetical protein